jgi:hypothetical protein
MRRFSKFCILLVLSLSCYAQTAQPPATAAELQYFQFVLMNLASLDHGPDAVTAFETSLVPAFGLNSQEAATIHAAGQALKTVLAQIRRTSASVMASGAAALTPEGSNTLATLAAQRQSAIATLANQILNSVRPQTAERMRTAGDIVAAALKATKGGN